MVELKPRLWSNLRVIFKDFPKPIQDRPKFRKPFAIVLGTCNSGFPDTHQFIYVLLGVSDAIKLNRKDTVNTLSMI